MQLFAMNNAVFMAVFVIMGFVSLDVLTMWATLARTALCSSLVFQIAERCWRLMPLANIVHLVNRVSCSSWKWWLSCQTIGGYSPVLLGKFLISSSVDTVMQLLNGLPAG